MNETASITAPPAPAGRTWTRLCAARDVPEDEGFRVTSVPAVVAFRQEDQFFCTDDTCTHEDYSLAEGWVEDGVVECTLHCAKFSLRTGAVVAPPATVPLATHPVAVVGEALYAALPDTYLMSEEL